MYIQYMLRTSHTAKDNKVENMCCASLLVHDVGGAMRPYKWIDKVHEEACGEAAPPIARRY